MKIRILLYYIFAFLYTYGFGQNAKDINDQIIEYQNIVFTVSDTAYECTLFIKPTGDYFFRNGFSDPLLPGDTNILIWFNRKEDGDVETVHTSYQFHSNVDTIAYAFHDDHVGSMDCRFTNIENMLNTSYVLRQLGAFSLDSVNKNEIRLLYPCEDFSYSNQYHVVTLYLYSDSVRINGVIGASVDYSGFQLYQSSTALLKKGDIKRLMRQMKKILLNVDIKCEDQGNPWILEYYTDGVYNRFAISNYCVHENRDLVQHARLSFLILGLSKRYLNIKCD